MDAKTNRTAKIDGIVTMVGTLSGAEERGPRERAYGYARLNTVDRRTGRESQHELIAEGEVFARLRDSWYDGLKADLSVIARGDVLHVALVHRANGLPA